MAVGNKKTTVNKFRDDLVLAIIAKHGLDKRSDQYRSPDFRISHGSTAIVGWKVCVLCRKKASRNCPKLSLNAYIMPRLPWKMALRFSNGGTQTGS